MRSRVPMQHYNLRSANSYIGSSPHDLNAADARPGEMEGVSDVDRDGITEDSLDNDDDSNSVGCLHTSYRTSLQIHGVGVDEDRTSLEDAGSSRSPYDVLSIDDVSPIETARARFVQIVVDHFINEHVIEVSESSEPDYGPSSQDKATKRKVREVQYEGDPGFVLPLMYAANLYESLVNDVNMRLASLEGIRDKTIGVALEAAGGLYRRLAKKFPRKGPYTFKRRELTTSLETRARFPELVIHEEKRVRFVVVNGLVIVEKPTTMTIEDAEWFRRLTGRHDVAISSRDYKFYSPRHKYRRVPSHSLSNLPALPAFSNADNNSGLANAAGFRAANEPHNQQQPAPKDHIETISHQPQFHSFHQAQAQTMHQSQHFHNAHQCAHSSQLPDIHHPHESPAMSQHMACMQPCMQTLAGGHVSGRLHVMSTNPAKFCDECGAPYLRETSKFCSECGVKRLGI